MNQLKEYIPTNPPKRAAGTKILGIKSKNPIDLEDQLRKGLEYLSFRNLAQKLEISEAALGELIEISYDTLQRRRRNGRFNLNESETLYRVARILERSEELLGEEAKAWLREPVLALGNRTPLSISARAIGSELVLNLIGRLEHGVYS